MRTVIVSIIAALFLVVSPSFSRGCVDIELDRVFADVPFDHPFCEEIESLYRDGLTTGCGVGESGELYFCPDQSLTRAMAAVFVEHRDPFAQLEPNGRVNIGDHVATAGRSAEGVYWVQFTRNISRCSMEAWTHDRTGPGVEASIKRLSPTTDTVVVKTTLRGVPLDLRFNARLHCR